MGMDISAHLTYGIKIPKEFENSNEDIEAVGLSEFLEDLIDPWQPDKEKKYEGLEIVSVGYCDEPEFVIATINHSVVWTAVAIKLEDLTATDPDPADELYKFCNDLNIEYDPQWYLSCYYSH